MYTMNRYQIYLDPHTVRILDDFQKVGDVSRSRLIRGAVESLARNLSQLVSRENEQVHYMATFDKLVGHVSKTIGKSTTIARKSDREYLRD